MELSPSWLHWQGPHRQRQVRSGLQRQPSSWCCTLCFCNISRQTRYSRFRTRWFKQYIAGSKKIPISTFCFILGAQLARRICSTHTSYRRSCFISLGIQILILGYSCFHLNQYRRKAHFIRIHQHIHHIGWFLLNPVMLGPRQRIKRIPKQKQE